MNNKIENPNPVGLAFRKRVWNVKAKRFLYAEDYGLKAFPIPNKKLG